MDLPRKRPRRRADLVPRLHDRDRPGVRGPVPRARPALVLDGVVDLAEPGGRGPRRRRSASNGRRGFAAWCRDEDGCPISAGPIAAIEAVTRAAEREPIPVDAAGRRATGEVTLAMVQALYSPSGWDDLAEAFDDARSGDGTGLVRLADLYLGVADFGAYLR